MFRHGQQKYFCFALSFNNRTWKSEFDYCPFHAQSKISPTALAIPCSVLLCRCKICLLWLIIYQADLYDAGYRVKGLFFHLSSKSVTVLHFVQIQCHRIFIHKIVIILNSTSKKKTFTDFHLAFRWNETLFNFESGGLKS